MFFFCLIRVVSFSPMQLDTSDVLLVCFVIPCIRRLRSVHVQSFVVNSGTVIASVYCEIEPFQHMNTSTLYPAGLGLV